MKAIISAKEFKRIIDNTKKFLGPSYGHMDWIYLKLDAEKKLVKATALDGHRISIEYAMLEDVDESFSCYVKPNIPKITKSDISAELELENNKLYITVGNSITGYIQPEGEYYKTDNMISDIEEQVPIRTIGVNAKFLKEAMESISASISNNRSIAKIDIRNPVDPIVIRSGGGKGKKENLKIILPIRLAYEESKAGCTDDVAYIVDGTCGDCGHEVAADWAYCPGCGRRFMA